MTQENQNDDLMSAEKRRKSIMAKDPVTRLRCSLGIVDGECIRLGTELCNEKGKPSPSRIIIKYLETRMDALTALSQNLSLKDMTAVDAVINLPVFSLEEANLYEKKEKEAGETWLHGTFR